MKGSQKRLFDPHHCPPPISSHWYGEVRGKWRPKQQRTQSWKLTACHSGMFYPSFHCTPLVLSRKGKGNGFLIPFGLSHLSVPKNSFPSPPTSQQSPGVQRYPHSTNKPQKEIGFSLPICTFNKTNQPQGHMADQDHLGYSPKNFNLNILLLHP